MGGNAFNAVGKESQRMDLETFNGVKQDVYNFLTQLGIEYLDIAYIRDKTSFGDLDVLVVENGDSVFNKIKENKDQLGLLDYQYFRNGMVTSILYKDKYQVDFIKTTPDIKLYHQAYLSHNDLGNLIGRTTKESGFKHGHDGFYYTYYHGTEFKRDILISKDFNEPLRVLGLDVDHFARGFDTLNEMFDYVLSSKYFKPSFYSFENLNNRNRVRDAKRKNYNEFLKYIAGKPDSEHRMPKYDVLYPHLVPIIADIKAEAERKEFIKSKFNGQIVMELTNLSGKELGNFMGNFRKKYNDDVIYTKTPDEIKQMVLAEL